MRRIENKQREEAEKKREAQRKEQEIKRKAERRNDIQCMDKLEKRKEMQGISDQRAHDLLLINMMTNMLQGTSVQPQSSTTGAPMKQNLPYPPATTVQGTTQASISTSQTELDLVLSMKQVKLAHTSNEPTKRHKTNTNIDTTENPTPTANMSDAESHLPVGSTQPPVGVSNKGTSQSRETTSSTSMIHSSHTPNCRSTKHQTKHNQHHNTAHRNMNNNNNN